MNALNFRSTRGLAALGLGAAIFGASFLAISDSDPAAPVQAGAEPVVSQQLAPQGKFCNHQHRIRARLARMADRLEIKASQQEAWKAYGAVAMSMADASVLTRPAADADAATVLRYRAERAGEMAQKLAKQADATAALQAALTPEQRAVLDQMTRRFGGMEGHEVHLMHAPGPR